ncbi:uncharacterized protein PHACADRAFT_263813 [Phanerochaete carnosa HHB-10118-sp]|uniref:DUF1753-domain-containing protein n=1 Tax=Phanerochaete carnosa (strain HHB-10118-sp) TaxID=650164 RepID=K5VV95_PHACS|nr:uncharacterized protein PHACADRAFT_263813 [Phanerochaete carnosa HHB-10118-sp]EKM50494.1 hypothetical protein PHACADRAFT_263813 [Phanerochaete carnosa HHB-10118-sp]
MKLTLRPEWRLGPFASFLGYYDIKTGVTCAILFAVLNKVAGVYGLISVLTGAGGTAAQLSLYIYSVLGLIAFAWGLRAVGQEDPKNTLYFAHVFFADHIISTAWTVFFAVVWWIYTPHDGRRDISSAAQREIMEAGGGGATNMTDAERAAAAGVLWNEEKGLAATVIILGWLSKFYFALLIYSYAAHLRKGSYRTLPRSRPTSSPYAGLTTLPDEEEDAEDFYLLPVRGPPPTSAHAHTPSGSSFADFVSAPGRARRGNKSARKPSALNPANSKGADDELDEVLFDEDELAAGALTKGSTDAESTSASGSGGGESHDEDQVFTPGGNASRRASRANRP